MLRLAARTLPLLFALHALACTSRYAAPLADAPPRPVVERLSDERVRLRWPPGFATGRVAIYAGEAPDAIDRVTPLAVATANEIVLDDDDVPAVADDRRLYYQLVPASGPPVVVAERRLPLHGSDNFRDLGGYETVDGLRVRWNRVYRANELSHLTRGDLAYLSGLGLRLVCDLRSERERIARPNPVLVPLPPDELDLSIAPLGLDPGALRESIRTGGIAALGAEKLMRRAYRSFVTDYTEEWNTLFARLADPAALPTVFHCTAGKDRTGFAAALLLRALGVPEQTVYEDYLASNRYRARFRATVMRWVPLYSLFRTDPDDLLPLIEARPEYLKASFDAIAELHGSVDAFLEHVGVTPERRAALRANLLRAPEGAPVLRAPAPPVSRAARASRDVRG